MMQLPGCYIRAAAVYRAGPSETPAPGLTAKDKRHDPVVGAGLCALELALNGETLPFPDETAVIGVTEKGCTSHVARITDGLEKQRPRQGYFARAGGQTIATYAAMALETHGPAYTLSGPAAGIPTIFGLVGQFLETGAAREVLLIAAEDLAAGYQAAALILSPVSEGRPVSSLPIPTAALDQNLVVTLVEAVANR